MAQDVAAQLAAGASSIFGVMVESHLVGGNQKEGPLDKLVYGQSITDACLGWDDSLLSLDVLSAAVTARRARRAAKA